MIKRIFEQYLFEKGVLVGRGVSENAFYARFALANKLGISITRGQEYAHEDMIAFAAEMLGEDIPAPFYRGFPRSVLRLTKNQRLFDQLFHYAVTYGLGCFDEPGYSLFEEDFARLAFRENTEVKKFVILTEEEALSRLGEGVADMLAGTRPLSDGQYCVLRAYIEEYAPRVDTCACKDTAVRLLLDTRRVAYAAFLSLSDVIKLVDTMNVRLYRNGNIKKLNLRNQDRKLITAVIHKVFENGFRNVRECFEKKAVWCGLLHHIHFRAESAEEEQFVALMRGKENRSVYSAFERAMLARDVETAVSCLREGKGSAALLRHLNYILSRCKNETEVALVLDAVKTENAVVLLQLLMQYASYKGDAARTFVFSRHNKLKVHEETAKEKAKRRSVLDEERVRAVSDSVRGALETLLANKLGRVYISPDAYRVALPLKESVSNGGYGVLPKGSRLPLEKGKKLRAFTYWERVNDIDLSVIGITEDGREIEFSWRTMYGKQSRAIVYSGDQTSGYKGGSEYFDIDLPLFKKKHPDIEYLVFCDNVYSDTTFDRCLCKAGYMIRDKKDSGEVFEPKTVKSSFTVNCDSTFAYLFGIDLKKDDFVWLNMARNSAAHVAGETSASFLRDAFDITSVMNLGMLFEMLARERVTSAMEADVVVSDEEIVTKEGATVVRSYDFEKIMSLIG